MKNVQKLMKDGVDTPRSYLGHTGSVTVVTHNVITSGQLPKHMGWTDEGYRDVAGILGDPEPTNPDQLYITSDFGSPQMFALQQAAGYPKLADYLGTADPTAKTFTISPKGYAGYAFGGAGIRLDHHLQQRALCTTPAGSSGASPAASTCRRTSSVLPCSRFWVHSGYPDLRLRHHQAAGGALPARQRPLRDRPRPRPRGRRRLGRRRGGRDHA